MFEIKTVTLRDKKTGKNTTRYYAEVYLSHGRKIPLILHARPESFWKLMPKP